jgi:hypothetical protein
MIGHGLEGKIDFVVQKHGVGAGGTACILYSVLAFW